jgi:hypothetical protein
VSNAFRMHVVMSDGTSHDVRTDLRDQLRYEEAARRGKWGPPVENLLRYEAFVAWSACERAGLTTASMDDWSAQVEQVDSEVISPVPTQAGPSLEPT